MFLVGYLRVFRARARVVAGWFFAVWGWSCTSKLLLAVRMCLYCIKLIMIMKKGCHVSRCYTDSRVVLVVLLPWRGTLLVGRVVGLALSLAMGRFITVWWGCIT